MGAFHYSAQDGGHLATREVTIRKMPADAGKAKPFAFLPLAANGTDRVKVERRTLDSAQTLAYIAGDAEARAAILAAITPLVGESNIAPTASQLAAMVPDIYADGETFLAALASGEMLVPSDRAERAAGTSADKRKMSEAERTAAAVGTLFARFAPVRDIEAERDVEVAAQLAGAVPSTVSHDAAERATAPSEPTTPATKSRKATTAA